MEKDRGVKRELRTEEAVPELCSVLAETLLLLASKKERIEVENIILLFLQPTLTEESFVGTCREPMNASEYQTIERVTN